MRLSPAICLSMLSTFAMLITVLHKYQLCQVFLCYNFTLFNCEDATNRMKQDNADDKLDEQSAAHAEDTLIIQTICNAIRVSQ